ncbi:alpha/beta fold hydrolase [Microlunatus soli]|uniref:Pimeloyl-ACP methyl ester carboxylesterase n=1 Tax=Microlunatus soli TaxID=630515 RepID=A0A1H2AGB1_9ACTN|nr:alpha/beta hydrolase [Microlunatus soli]SDT45055.1 Pimeloyl-ACP methyl ester carboxylesterase [Microlunatus soli]
MTISDDHTSTAPPAPGDQHPAADALPRMLDSDELITLDGVDLHVCQNGPADAPALLLIHGTGASARSWEPMLGSLTGSHRVIRIDLLGCGRSSRPDDGNYAVTDQVRRIGVLLDRLGVGRVVVAGHSSGGVFATALAVHRPDLLDGVVLINTGPRMSAYIAADVPLRNAAWSDLTDDQIRAAIRDGFHPGFAIPASYVDQFREIDFEAFGAVSVAIRSYLEEQPLPDRLAPIGRPLLVIFGDQDQRWDPAAAADYHAVRGARITMMPGLGHSPNLEDPQRTAAALLTFTAAHTADVGSGRD